MTPHTLNDTSRPVAAPPLSASQRRLLALHDRGIEPRQVFGLDIRERIDAEVFRAALCALVSRYAVLRSYYPRQSPRAAAAPVVASRYEPHIDVVMLDAAPPDDQQRHLATLRSRLQTMPLALAARPQAVFVIVKLAARHWHLLGMLPAINADGRSVSLLIRELTAAYRAGGTDPEAADTPQFHHIAAWMNGEATSADSAGRAFWRRYLADVPWRISLPLDRASAAARFAAAVMSWDLPRIVWDRAAGGDPGASWIEARLIAAAAAWLSRLGDGMRRVSIGVSYDGRRYDELRHAIGPYDAYLPLVVEVGEHTTFDDLDEQIGGRLGELREWRDWFDGALAEGSDGGPAEIAYPICVDVRHGGDAVLGGTFALASLLTVEDTYGIKLTCEVAEGRVRAEIAYNAAIYTPDTVRRVQQQLDAILEADDARALVLRAQRRGVEERTGVAPVEPMPDVADAIHARIERQAAAVPDRLAIVEGDQHVSYGALNTVANRFAHRLRARCAVSADALVALRMQTSLEVQVAILAVWKTGSAFVPLDPEWPASRTEAVLRRAGVVAVVASPHDGTIENGAIEDGPGEDGAPPRLVCDPRELWADRAALAANPASLASLANPAMPAAAANLAYVLFTSGTSGTPKGAMITHGGLANYLGWAAEAYALASGRRALVHSPVTFDFTLTCLLGPLTVGGCVQVCRGDHPLEALAEAMSSAGDVSAIKVTPSSIDPLGRLLARKPISRVGHVIVGGEALFGSPPLWSLARESGAVIVNEYGPTECVVGSCVWEGETGEGPIPIGRPIANTTIQLLTRDGQPAATWAEGEIHIGGHGLARGYLAQPALTAASFVPRAHGGRPGERLYATGDIARRSITGALVYLHRRDSQVKIRGYRIELAEVEQAIRACPGVADCVVTTIARTDSHPQLIACLVGDGRQTLPVTRIRDHLRTVLPAYMVPAALHVVPSLPVSAHGKVDVHALHAVLAAAERAQDDMAAPRSEVEHTLLRLWQDVLRHERIGIDENFFELGGDSILSIQFLARAHDAGVRLRPRDLEAHPTIRGLAAVAARATPRRAPTAAAPRTGDVPLAPMQRRFFEWKFAEPHHYNQSVLLTAPATCTRQHVEQAVRALVARHDALRLAFDTSGAAPRQFYDDQAATRSVVRALDGAALTEFDARLRAIADEAQRSIDLHAAPLLRIVFCSRGQQARAFLYVVVHHLIVDHVSWTILLDDLRRALDRAAAGAPIDRSSERTSSDTPSNTSSQSSSTTPADRSSAAYGEWIAHVVDRARRGDLSRARSYWLDERWKGVPAVRVDHPTAAVDNLVEDEESVSVSLSQADTDVLLHRTAKAYQTRVIDLLVAAYAMAYAGWSGASVQAIDLEGHGRDAVGEGPAIERTIGWFTALHPVHLRLTRPGDIRTSIQDTKEALRAVPDNGVDYGLLRDLASPEDQHACRALHRAGVAFNYLGQVAQTIPQHASIAWVPTRLADNRSPRNRRTHVLDVGMHISDGELRATFVYSRALHQRASIAALADAFVSRLASMVAHCAAQRTSAYTPSDFPLAALSQETLDAIAAAHPDVEDIYPLSDTQQGMLFYATRATTSTAYVVQLAAVLHGRLDEERFEASWRTVIARHSALRTSFLWESVPEPLQIVHRGIEPVFVKEDWRDQHDGHADRAAHDDRVEPAIEVRLDAWLLAQRTAGIDLASPPLRFALLRLGEERYQFVWLYHHILIDGWSTINVLREVLACYASASGFPLAPERPALPYRDYIAWLSSRRTQDSRAYWQQAMAGLSAGTVLALPRAARAADGAPQAHAHQVLSLGAHDSDALTALVRRLQLTPNVLVEGAWALVLARYARTDDVVFGVTVSGRPHHLRDVEHRVGLFLNTLPMRLTVDRQSTVDAYLKTVNARLQGLLEHGHMPLVDVQRLSDVAEPERLFDTIVVFENFPSGVGLDALQGELDVTGVRSIEQTNYPLTIVVGSPDGALSIKALYDRHAFAPAFVQQLLGHFIETLRWMVHAGDAPIGSLAAAWSHLREAEPPPVLDVDPAWAHPLHAIFERQAAATPDAVAVVDPVAALSYRGLNRRANQIASLLIDRGVRPGAAVSICVERSVDMIAAILATLKAGAAYVPIDARFPAKRIQRTAAKTPVVITDWNSRSHFADRAADVIDLDGDSAALAAAAAANPIGIATPLTQAAYVMHTSGSSGEPKGVIVTHENVTRLLSATSALYACGTRDVWSFFHSIAFDFSVWEIFGALLTGGRVVVTPYWTARSPEQFADVIRGEQVTILSQTPSAFQQLTTIGGLIDPAKPPHGLCRIVFGGEALRVPPVRDALLALRDGGVQIVNMYGITETTVHVTHRAVDDLERLDSASLIGSALPHLRLHLLDRHLWPTPDGIAGEICVAGDGLAHGYAGSPRLTAERFVPSPIAGDVGKRLYRSGDLGRAVGERDCEYLGRSDSQVKIRGFRIEPGEIRAQLLRQPGVRDALVRGEEDRGDRVLAAYVIPANAQLSAVELWTALRQQLPEHMVPAAITLLDRFPLTPNGKIDVEALGRLPGTRRQEGFVPPQTWEQEVIADVWGDVLGRPSMGIRDDFFTAGGDSIKALRVIAGMRARGFAVTTELLYQHATIAELARVAAPVDANIGTPADESTGAPIGVPGAGGATPSDAALEELARTQASRPDDAVDSYPATQLQLGMLFHAAEEREGDALFHNVTLLTLQGGFDERRFRAAVDRAIARHPALRTAFAVSGLAVPLQIVYRQVASPVTVVRLDGLPASEQRRHLDEWFAHEKRCTFAIDAAPLIRFHVLVCGDDLFHLGVTEHHAILDGWSVASLLAELFQSYAGASDEGVGAASYAADANTCRSYVLLERTALASPAQRAFWTEYLSDHTPLQLPAKWLGGGGAPAPAAGVRKLRVALAAGLTAGLRELARGASTPLKSVALAAHLAVLSYISNSADVITGVISHGRPETERSEEALGLFLNTLPLRVRVEDRSWKQWIRTVFDEERRILPYRRFPLAAMRDRTGQAVPVTTAFNYTHFHVYDRLEQHTGVRDVAVDAATNFQLLIDFSVMSRTAELELTISYDAAAFSGAQVASLAECYRRCLASMAGDPDARLSAAVLVDAPLGETWLGETVIDEPLLDAAPPTRAAALGDTRAIETGGWTTLVELLRSVAQSAPADRIAVVDGERHLTYRELGAQVDALAHRLRTAGVTEDSAVAVLMDKSLEWIVSALAIIRAGGAYAPVDPSDPAERLRFIVSHIGAPVVVTDERGAELLRGVDSLPQANALPDISGEVRIERLAPRHRSPSAPPPHPSIAPEHLAYILHTSGSTGQPKGVAVPHAAIANLMNTQSRDLPLARQRILQYASPAFDVSIQEIFTALSAAGTLVLVPSAVRRDFVSLAQLIADEQIQALFAPDTVIRALLLAARASGIALPALGAIVQAGEPLIVDTASSEFLAAGGALYNHYGPTESHVVTTGRMTGGDLARPSIGREIDRTHLLVLDRWLRRVPAGTIGELYIVSPNVARGYHRAPRMTAERFVPVPYDAPGARAFKTGDLGYRRRDGALMFRGRSDTQVKLRGYRIELDEIRHAIVRDARITDAVVTLIEHHGEKRLRGYVVSAAPVDAEALRTSLAGRVPSYMVPASIVQVPAIPLTRNGKLDYAALSAMAPDARLAPPPRPTGAIGRQLLELWREVLGAGGDREPGDDFLDSGGDSILLLKLQLSIRARFALNVPLAVLALNSSLDGMSRCLEEALAAPPAVRA